MDDHMAPTAELAEARIVDTPSEAVELICQGIADPWFTPTAPAAPAQTTAEGTREGTVIRQATEEVAPVEDKPQQ